MSVAGLHSAVKLYGSDRIKDRAQGAEHIREIFSNPENLLVYQEKASRDGGASWSSLFHSLFQVVILEKKAVTKKDGKVSTAQAEKRLAEAISLVRWVTERCVHLIAKKPFMALYNHMVDMLVYGTSLFQPASLDYAKALRRLLSYPPHLDALDQEGWKALMGICWAVVLDDSINSEEDWQDDTIDGIEVEEGKTDRLASALAATQFDSVSSRQRASTTQAKLEMVQLLPVLLSTSAAPLLPPPPTAGSTEIAPQSVGSAILLKIYRFFLQNPDTETPLHLSVLQTLNIVLGEFELNCRRDMEDHGCKLFPHIVGLWTTRNKMLREQLVIALRILLPFLTHPSISNPRAQQIKETATRFVDVLGKETISRWGIQPLKLDCVRLRNSSRINIDDPEIREPFSLSTITAGFGYTHEVALTWTILELYADCVFYLSHQPETIEVDNGSRTAKRQRMENPIVTLIQSLESGPYALRTLCLQVLIFVMDRQGPLVPALHVQTARETLLRLLDSPNEPLQAWALVGLSITFKYSATTDASSRLMTLEPEPWLRAWTFAIRKISSPGLCRAACLLANEILACDVVSPEQMTADVRLVLTDLDVRSPTSPSDAVCAFLAQATTLAKSDVTLYNLNLEDRVLRWLDVWTRGDGVKNASRLEQFCPDDLLELLCATADLQSRGFSPPTSEEMLPDCPIVTRVLVEGRTRPIRAFVLHGSVPVTGASTLRAPTDLATANKRSQMAPIEESLTVLVDRPRRISDMLSDLLRSLVGGPNDANESIALGSPELARRVVDLSVAAIGFQAILQVNGIGPDTACLSAAAALMKQTLSVLRSSSAHISGQHLVWRGFLPLVGGSFPQFASPWPILLGKQAMSGIRPDQHIIKSVAVPSAQAAESTSSAAGLSAEKSHDDEVQTVMWRFEEVRLVYEELMALALLNLADNRSNTASEWLNGGDKLVDEDDFGPIQMAETDAMPMSKESIECQRVAESLRSTLLAIRLRGLRFFNSSPAAIKDLGALNAWLAADGARFVQLGLAVCDAVAHGQLRLSVGAIDRVLAEIEEMIRSYGFIRDVALSRLVIAFLKQSASIWLGCDPDTSDIGIRAVALMKFMIEKTARGQVTAWQVRLAIVDLIDFYLTLDPQSTYWESCRDDDDDMDGSELALNPGGWTPEALVDVDARVRYRAATSAALIITRLSLHPHDQNTFYFTALQRQPGLVSHWDSFLTHLLWKLNCCVVSASLRPATLYHLFEIPLSTSEVNDHVRLGLQAVAKVLGFASVPELLQPYVPVLMRSVLGSGQNILRTPFDVFGWQSAQEQARFLLDHTGANLLAKPEAPMYLQLCATTLADPAKEFERHIDAAAALISADAPGSGVKLRLPDLVIQTVAGTLPRLRKGDLSKLIAQQAESIAVELLMIVDLAPNADTCANDLRQGGVIESSVQLYRQLAGTEALGALLEPRVDLPTFIVVLNAWHTAYPQSSPSKIVYNAIMRLSYACHQTLLLNEQCRYIRSIALAITLYSEEFKHPLMLQAVLREMTQLLRFESIWPSALAILRWGYTKIAQVERPLQDQAALLVSLGRVYRDLARNVESPSAPAILSWVQESLNGWRKQPALGSAIEQVHCVWPPAFQNIVTDWTTPTWTDLSLTLDNQLSDDSLELCKQLAALQTRTEKYRLKRDFKSKTFWQIKDSLPAMATDAEGMLALLDLLYSSDGAVEPPRLLVHHDNRTAAQVAQRAFSSQVKTKYASEPLTAMRMVIVAQIIRLISVDDIRQRSIAIGILASMLPYVPDLVNRNLLGADTNDLLSVVIPASPASLSPLDGKLGDLNIEAKSKYSDPEVWTRRLATVLLQHLSLSDEAFRSLPPILQTDICHTQDLLPWLVQSALLPSTSPEPLSDDIPSVKLSDFFTVFLDDPATDIKILETIIKVILHLRNYMPIGRKDPLAYNSWLAIEPMTLASAAVRCGAFASALLFLELAGESETFDLASAGVQDVGLDVLILTFKCTDGQVMYAIYSNVEDPDGFYGIQTTDPESALIRRLEHEGQSWRAFGINGALHEATSGTATISAANAVASNLHKMGFNTLASTLTSVSQNGRTWDGDSHTLSVELAWRTGNWDLPTSTKDQSIDTAFYLALRSVHRDRSQAQASSIVQTGLREELERLRSLGIERITDVKSSVASLMCMREIAVWLAPAMQTALAEGDDRSPQLAGLLDVPSSTTYAESERLLSTRLSLIGAAKAKEMVNLFGDLSNPQVDILNSLEKACRIKLSELAREDGNSQAAVNAVTAVRQLERGQIPSIAADDEFAQVLWSMGEHSLATTHVEQMSKRLRGDDASSARLAVLLGRVADWSSLAQTKPAQEIKRYFDEAIQLGRAHNLDQKETARLSHEYACFADRQLISITKSPELDRLRTYTQSNPSSAELSATLSKSSTKRGGSSSAVEARIKEAQEDEAALTALEREIKTYVKTALRMFATALCYSNDFDDSMTRLCSLWLEYEEHEEVNKSFSVSLSRIPSHKFIFLGPQLTARLNRPTIPTTFDTLLKDLILRISRDHPFHILYQIITLSHGVKAAKGASRVSNVDAEGRGPAAMEVLKHLEADSANALSQNAVANMRRFVETAIPWCLYKEPDNAPITPEGEHGLPPTERLASLKAVQIPVSTVTLAIDPTKKYANVPTIMRYRQRYRLLGGIHKPKRMSCVDTLGAQHYQLFKGEDEVRQDAVMEQVFQLTNDLLNRDRKSKSRKLRFRTYNVIPLPQRTGVIEFVSDGQGIGEWLKPAHERYRKDVDHSPDSMRKQLNPIQEKDWNSPKMTEMFNKLLLKFKPVMRHFFTEKHKDSTAWFAMRLNYSRSVAVTSMVGHVLGIGDRHCSNILIDTVQGELVHIDFGIVFEEGRRLRVPEKVPFRLTNDIVDGLGITGIEGTFRRCSEHSLRVLRESADLILTVLEVFKHDPLYAWTADSEKLQRAQGGRKADAAQSSTAGQEKADRILARVRQKLRPDLSVEFTVGQLIQEARDVENLSKIFVGWQPWL